MISPLKRALKNAEIIEVGMPEAAELVKSGRVDVFAANKANLFAISDKLPGSRVLDGRFPSIGLRSEFRRDGKREWVTFTSSLKT